MYDWFALFRYWSVLSWQWTSDSVGHSPHMILVYVLSELWTLWKRIIGRDILERQYLLFCICIKCITTQCLFEYVNRMSDFYRRITRTYWLHINNCLGEIGTQYQNWYFSVLIELDLWQVMRSILCLRDQLKVSSMLVFYWQEGICWLLFSYSSYSRIEMHA